MNKKKIGLIAICILIILLLFIRGVWKGMEEDAGNDTAFSQADERIIRASMAKAVCFLFYDREEVLSISREITYTDTDESQWFDKYINAMYALGLDGWDMENPLGEKYRPFDYVTYGECRELLERLSVIYGMEQDGGKEILLEKLENAGISIEQWKEEEYVAKTQWDVIYEILMENLADGKIIEKELFLFGILQDGGNSGQWEIVTDNGIYCFDGIQIEPYMNQTVKAFVRGNTVLSAEETNNSTTLRNVWIEKTEEKAGKYSVTLFFNGVKGVIETENRLSDNVESMVGDITVQNRKVTRVKVKPDTISGKVLVTNDENIVIQTGKGEKTIPLDSDFKIYRLYHNQVENEAARGILVGYSKVEFVMEGDSICAALIRSRLKAENIRVLIKSEGFQELYHEKVELTSNYPFEVTFGEKTKNYEAFEHVELTPDSKMLSDGRVFIKSKMENGKLTLLSLRRNGENPAYRGSMEISFDENGKLLLINELPLEQYLYAVLPSEMPSNYGVEALKVQAVCARSYAYNQLMSNSYRNYGAHVDDSVSYQVYNNLPENENTIIAVKETYGQVLEYDNKIITAYYFSTSCGHTSNAGDVWMGTGEIPYLKGSWQKKDVIEGEKEADLTEEESFRTFITQNGADTYDSGFAWYRWNVRIPAAHLKKTIDSNLAKRYKANSDLILTLNEDGNFESMPIDTIGKVKNIVVLERKTGGIATSVLIEGSRHTIKVQSEYNIRMLLAPSYDTVVRQDDSRVENMNMLPSSFFVVDRSSEMVAEEGGQEEKEKVYFTFQGGGYGHGVGMSQNGAKAMADEKISYEDILKHYYKGVSLGFIY